MAITPIVLTNPGAETGDVTGWIVRTGPAIQAITSAVGGTILPYAGSYMFWTTGNNVSASKWDQHVAIPAGLLPAVSGGGAAARARVRKTNFSDVDKDIGKLYIEAYAADGVTLLGSHQDDSEPPYQFPWGDKVITYFNLPTGAEFLRIGVTCTRDGLTGGMDIVWDNFELEISDNGAVDYAGEMRVSQALMFVAEATDAEAIRSTQISGIVVAEPDISLRVTQAVYLVAIRRDAGSRRLRAWTFTQDDHDFYVLHLDDDKTLILDLMTNQWSVWKSDGIDVWRASIGGRWGVDNVAGDHVAGLLWDINPDERSDDAITGVAGDRVPIQSIIRGLYPMRLRNALSCYRAVLTVSQGDPEVVGGGVGIQLRTSDDFGRTWQDHGLLVLDQADTEYDIAWPSIGLITAPGKIFEIIDTGYARRIDALDIDLGPDEGKVAEPSRG